MKFGIYTLVIEDWSKIELPLLHHGWGNGYILLPTNHPLYGISHDNFYVSVHGGL